VRRGRADAGVFGTGAGAFVADPPLAAALDVEERPGMVTRILF
jgi:hypothetical protein